MKKFFTTKKNKTLASIIAGIALAGLLSIGSSYITTNLTEAASLSSVLQAEEFISTGSGSLMSRIGSLTVGSANSAYWIADLDDDCAAIDNDDYSKTCLGVQDDSGEGAHGTFSKLWIDAQGLFMDGVVVSTTGHMGATGGIGWLEKAIAFAAALPEPAFLIHDIEGTTEDSILISGLGYYESGALAPRNLTSQREVCATSNGMLTICNEPPAPVNGACGRAHGNSYENPPAFGLCSSGTPSAVTTGSGTYNWTCAGSNGGSTDICSATVAEPDSYSWYVGSWGMCLGTSGSCTGTPQQGAKVDWNGNPFEWEDGRVYKASPSGNPELMTICASEPNLPYDHSAGQNFDWDAAWLAAACITQASPYTWPSVVYEPSTVNGMWHRINTEPGVGGDIGGPGNSNIPGYIHSVNLDNSLYQEGIAYRARCDFNNNGILENNEGNNGYCGGGTSQDWGDWTPKSPTEYCAPHRPGTYRTDIDDFIGYNAMNPEYDDIGFACVASSSGSCGGQNELQCNGSPGCTWNPGSGDQSRTVECRDQDNNVVADSYCIPPNKPATSQAC